MTTPASKRAGAFPGSSTPARLPPYGVRRKESFQMESLAITCPKCGFTQPEGKECTRCGVIFAKVHGPQPPPPPIEEPSLPVWSPDADTRRKFRTLVVLLLLLVFVLGYSVFPREIRYPPGILVPSQPQQITIKNPVPWQKDKRLVVPLAQFNLKARVLGKEKYRSDGTSDISPIDLALGWGPMSDQRILDQLEITQGSRRFLIMPLQDRPPLPIQVLLAHSSNMHMLPANAEVKEHLDALRVGELVELSGSLVGIQESGRWTWVSSLRRDDTGDGACEIFWVERVKKFTKG